MVKSKQNDSIPEHFINLEEAAEFWDHHDLADYWDLTTEANFETDISATSLFNGNRT